SYIEEKRQQLAQWNTERGVDMGDPVNARHLTNVGTFRAYVLAFLKNHPEINQDMTLLVRQLEPGATGLPIEIYCFTTDTAWASYERTQADIFDHLLAVAREFDLSVYQNPTGSDFRALN
ncbi:MAG: mechanosensitive ion channel, partial [Gammaproteobacteria bacterium]|nr:mechanosensitive ion channel [Gammaproteobacteria bacterium]